MKDTVLDRNFRVMMLKMGYTESDIRDLFVAEKYGAISDSDRIGISAVACHFNTDLGFSDLGFSKSDIERFF